MTTGKKPLLLMLCLVFVTPSLWAGGWSNFLIGCRAISMGAFAGLADDPSAIFYNPAGLAFQESRASLSLGGFYVRPTHEYSLSSGPAVQSRHNDTLPQVFFTYRTGDKFTLGLGVYAPYATGGVDWTEDQVGFPLKSYLGILAISPTLSYRVSDRFSLGFQINLYAGALDIDTVFGEQGPVTQEETGTALSASLGLLFKPNERLSFGIGLHGPSSMTLKGKTSLEVEAPGFGVFDVRFDSETSFKLPWDFEIGTAWQVSDRLLLSGSVQYTLWSALERVDKVILDVPETGDIHEFEELDFQNILFTRIGGEFRLTHGLVIRGGIGMDRAASPAQTLSINNIDVDKFTVLAGVGYRVGKTVIDLAYVRAFGKERTVERSNMGFPFSESYNLNVNIVGLGLTYGF